MVNPPFRLAKILDQGTSNPIVNRLTLQFFEIFNTNLIRLPKQSIEQIKKILFECMKDLLEAEELLKEYLECENKAIQKIIEAGVEFQPNAFSYEDPSIKLIRFLEAFLIRCVVALRRTIKIAELVFNKEFKGPEKLRSHLFRLLAPDSPYRTMLEEDTGWYKELYDLRGLVEHSKLEVTNFEVILNDEGKPVIKLPVLVSKSCIVREYMEVTLYNVFTYCEDFTAMLLNMYCDERVHIVQLPNELQPKYRGFRYVLDLKDEYKKLLFKETGKDKSNLG